jgi:hypothetical protein
MKLEFSRQIFGKAQIYNFFKVRPVWAELFHADGLTDITKLLVTLRNVANAPKNHSVIGICCPRYRQHRKTNEENIECKYAIFRFLCCCQLILISELTVTCIIYWTRIENLFKTNLRFLNDLCSLKHVYISGCHQSSVRALLSAERLQ